MNSSSLQKPASSSSSAPGATRVLSVPAASVGTLAALLLTASALPAQDTGAPATAPLPANEEVVALDELVISARNRTEKAQDVPIPVAVLDSKRLENESLLSSGQFVTRVPNTTYFDSNPKQTNISIRGIGKNANNERIETSVGLIVDDVYLVAPGSAASDFVDLERIEVLRGPQGTLKGKNTTLGVLNIVTKEPSFTPSTWLEVGAGTNEYKSFKASSTGPIIDNKLAFRASVNYRQADGYLENPVDSNTLNDTNRIAGRFQLLATPSETFSAKLIYDGSNSDEHSVFNPVYIADPTTYSNGVSRGLTYSQRIARSYFQNRYAWSPSQNDYDHLYANNNDGVKTYRNTGTLHLTKEIGEWQVESISGVSRFSFDPGNDSDPYDITRAGSTSLSDQKSQEVRLSSPIGPKVDFQTGIYYLKNDYTVNPPTGYGFGRDAGAFYATNPQYATLNATATGTQLMQASLDGMRVGTFSHAGSDSLAEYAQANWHVTDKSTLTLGLRFTQEERYYDTETLVTTPGQDLNALGASIGASPAEIAAANAIRNARTASVAPKRSVTTDNESLGWLINPSYKVNKDVLAYGILSYGEKSPVVGFNGTQPIVSDPEEVLNTELGVKTTLLGGRLRLNANVFNTIIQGYQTTVRVLDPIINDGVTYANIEGNVDEIISRGVELEGVFALTRSTNLTFAGAYNDAYYSSFDQGPLSPETQPGTIPFQNYTGEQVAGSSKYSFALGLDSSIDIGGGRKLFGAITETYRSEYNISNLLTTYGEQEEVFLTDVTVGISFQRGKYSLSLQGRNIFDEQYFVTGGDGSVGNTGGGAYTGSPGPRRFIGLVFRAVL